MAKTNIELLQDGAIERAERKLKEYWNIVVSASETTATPRPEDYARMAGELATSDNHSFTTPDGKKVTYEQIKAEAHKLLEQANLPEEQKQDFYHQLSARIPNSSELHEIANVGEDTAKEYDNWQTKLKYGGLGFWKMVQEDGFLAAIGEFISSLLSGDFSFGKIGQYGKQIAADDVEDDVKHRLTELSKKPHMQGLLNAETIDLISKKARERVLNPDAEETVTTPEERLKNVETLSFAGIAKTGIETMVDAKLDRESFIPKFRAGLEEAKKNAGWMEWAAMKMVSDNDIETIAGVIRDPLKKLLTSDKLDTSSPEKLKTQVANLVREQLKNNKVTGQWRIIQNQKGVDMIANAIADEVVSNREMLAKAHQQMESSNALAALDTDKKDGILSAKELGDQNKNNKLEQDEIAKMTPEQKAQFEKLLADDKYNKAVKRDEQGKHITEVDFNALTAVPGKPQGLQIG